MSEHDSHETSEILYASALASATFALECLEPVGSNLRAKSSFVNPEGDIMHWHDFGDLEGPGWAANAVGGAHLLYRWGAFVGDAAIREKALMLLRHVLEDGFVDRESGFIWPYYDLSQQRFCLNYKHGDDWLCPGSLAKIGVDMLDFADELQTGDLYDQLRQAAHGLGAWLKSHVSLLPNGWVPRRITRDGENYPFKPEGGDDPIFETSADGLYLLGLWTGLTYRKLENYRPEVEALSKTFITADGFWGSINHDTYDDQESVAYATGFRVLRRMSHNLFLANWSIYGYQAGLSQLRRFRMADDRNGVATRGLLWMEKSWDTAYLWENGEAAQAYLEAWSDSNVADYRDAGLDILLAIARHHHGSRGFLTEGVDWNNHVSQQHHVGGALYGDISYTEPLLNNLYFVLPTLTYFGKAGLQPLVEMNLEKAVALLA